MLESTLTSKGQTTVPRMVRDALGIKPQEQLLWDIAKDGSVTVRPKPSALSLFGSLRSSVPFPGIREEKEAARAAMAREAAMEGLDNHE